MEKGKKQLLIQQIENSNEALIALDENFDIEEDIAD